MGAKHRRKKLQQGSRQKSLSTHGAALFPLGTDGRQFDPDRSHLFRLGGGLFLVGDSRTFTALLVAGACVERRNNGDSGTLYVCMIILKSKLLKPCLLHVADAKHWFRFTDYEIDGMLCFC